MARSCFLIVLCAVGALAPPRSTHAAPKTPATAPAEIAFFETKIRPVLVKNCYACHSAEAGKMKGGLHLDSRDGILTGGESGPALVAKRPTESLILRAIRHDGLQMPPTERLPEAVAADFERWIKMGAPDPREAPAAKPVETAKKIDLAAARQYWAYRPLPESVALPKPADLAWGKSPIDAFIRAAQESHGLTPNGDADRTTLLRRVTIALTGLLPTPADYAAFEQDGDANAFEKVVDRLLASPEFARRWGRHWLDLARYSDSNGKDENLTFHEAFRYRDYVLKALAADKPWNEFILEQVAGDLLPAESPEIRDERMTATGFLVLGPKLLADRDLERRHMDVVDEQLDTIGRMFLGMTLGCARCHDHKFDPISQADYYAMAGIFNGTRTLDGFKLGNPIVSGWILRPLGGEAGEMEFAARKEHGARLAALAKQVAQVKADLKALESKADMREPAILTGITVDDTEAKLVGEWKDSTFTKPYVGVGYKHDDRAGKGQKSATFTPTLPHSGKYRVLLSYTTGGSRATNVPVTVTHADGSAKVVVDMTAAPKVDGLFTTLGTFRFEAGKTGNVRIETADTTGHVIVDAVRFIAEGEPAKTPATAKKPNAKAGIPADLQKKLAETQKKLADLEAEEKALKANAPKEVPLVMAVRDEAKPTDMAIHVRGNPHQLGKVIPRGFLGIFSPADGSSQFKIPADQSGRLEFARALVDPKRNPATPRVMVNRIWQHLFGEGIVATVDDFGVRGEKPTHPELLDYLAAEFVRDGWSAKKLIREIVLSRAYRVSSRTDAHHGDGLRIDPANRYLSRFPRVRVEAEVLRDAILQVSGELDRTHGGSAVAHLAERAIDNDSKGGVKTDDIKRRSVYLPIIRNELPAILDVFDFADPETATGRRDATTVATQALFLMNSPFIMQQAEAAAAWLAKLPDDASRVRELYRSAYGRYPESAELTAALEFVGAGADAAKSWQRLCQAVFASTEFRFVE